MKRGEVSRFFFDLTSPVQMARVWYEALVNRYSRSCSTAARAEVESDPRSHRGQGLRRIRENRL